MGGLPRWKRLRPDLWEVRSIAGAVLALATLGVVGAVHLVTGSGPGLAAFSGRDLPDPAPALPADAVVLGAVVEREGPDPAPPAREPEGPPETTPPPPPENTPPPPGATPAPEPSPARGPGVGVEIDAAIGGVQVDVGAEPCVGIAVLAVEIGCTEPADADVRLSVPALLDLLLR